MFIPAIKDHFYWANITANNHHLCLNSTKIIRKIIKISQVSVFKLKVRSENLSALCFFLLRFNEKNHIILIQEQKNNEKMWYRH